jgi:hypothetical protein
MAISTPLSLTGDSLADSLDFARPGMPASDGVYATVAFTPGTGGPTYQILRTTEFDAYESSEQTAAALSQLLQAGALAAAKIEEVLRAQPPVGDDFAGTARKAAKLSIGSGATEKFADVRKLIASLIPDSKMVHHTPPIDRSAASGRVAEEQRNVHLLGYLYAASHENDNDFHLIVGRDPSSMPDTYMTVEVSGLPPSSSAAYARLKSARQSFKTFFGVHVPLFTYDYYHPPIPVVIEGSLFFDIEHAIGSHPGPPSLKSRMPTIWEIHPVTEIVLGTHG